MDKGRLIIEEKFYVIYNKNLAITVSYLLGENYFSYADVKNEGKKVYSFRDTPKFRSIMSEVIQRRKTAVDK